MEEFISREQHLAEVNALKSEIKRLSQRENVKSDAVRVNPFDNPTEYESYSGKYEKIQPMIEDSNYRIPLDPDYLERKKLKKYYGSAGVAMLMRYFFVQLFSWIFVRIVSLSLLSANPSTSKETIYEYMKNSSILSGMNLIMFVIANVFFAFWGFRLAKVKMKSVFRTRDFTAPLALQYCLIGLFFWFISSYIIGFTENIFKEFGFDINPSGIDELGQTSLGFIVITFYSCIIAPLTEELLFRGMVLKIFSKANQRFGIFVSAFLFGIGHGNIPQFILAFILGIFLAHITLKHNSIVPSIIVHIFVNSVSSAISELPKDNSTMLFAVEMFLIAASALGLIMYFVFKAGNRLPSTTPAQARRGLLIAMNSFTFVILVAFEIFDLLNSIIS